MCSLFNKNTITTGGATVKFLGIMKTNFSERRGWLPEKTRWARVSQRRYLIPVTTELLETSGESKVSYSGDLDTGTDSSHLLKILSSSSRVTKSFLFLEGGSV